MNKDNGGPALPYEFKFGDGTVERSSGMTLRDYFAASVVQGLLSSSVTDTAKNFANTAYAIADEMIKARDRD